MNALVINLGNVYLLAPPHKSVFTDIETNLDKRAAKKEDYSATHIDFYQLAMIYILNHTRVRSLWCEELLYSYNSKLHWKI